MRIAIILMMVMGITATHVQAKPKLSRRGKSTKVVKKRGAPKFIKKGNLGYSMLSLVCPKHVWIEAQKSLPATTSPVYKAKFHSIKHTKKVRFAMGHFQCMYTLPGAKKPLSFHRTKREYPFNGEYANVQCTIEGRRMTCAERSMDIPNEPMETPKLPTK